MKRKMKSIVIDDMFLTTELSTSAGSKMLEGYQSLIASEALLRAQAAGYSMCDKVPVGEFAIDLLGETCATGAQIHQGILQNASTQMLLKNDVMAALCLDVNGYPRRAAAQTGLVCLKPTHGAVSCQGVVSVAPSGEAVDILAKEAEICQELFNAVKKENKKEPSSIRRVVVLTSFDEGINQEIKQKIEIAVSNLKNSGICTTYSEKNAIFASKTAWNVILCAEFCKNTARYDGVRYGHRAADFVGVEEL